MPDLKKLHEKAEKYLQKQKVESALETYQEIYKYQPHDSDVLVHLSDLSLALNRTRDALRYESLLVELYIKRNDLAKAVATCRKALKSAPHEVNALMKLASLLEKTQKQGEAMEAYREAFEIYRKAGDAAPAMACLQHIIKLDPENLDAQVLVGEAAARAGQPKVSAAAFLKAAQLAQNAGREDRWAEFVERAHSIDRQDETASTAAAEVFLKKGRAAEAAALLQPVAQRKPDDLPILELLARAYLRTGEQVKAEPLCWKLYQARPEKIDILLELVDRMAQSRHVEKALEIVGKLKGQLVQQGKRDDLLKVVEKVYGADENNPAVLEALANLYNESNDEMGLRRSLTRLFNLFLSGEQYQKAADTLDRIIDVDPYGEGHNDRLLNLEGHIDAVLYKNIQSRVEVSPGSSAAVYGQTARGPSELRETDSIDELIVEGEMYQQYQLPAKLKETLEKIDRLYPGAQEKNKRLRELYESAEFTPTPAPSLPVAAAAGHASAAAPSARSLEEIRKISEITGHIYRESTPQGVTQVAVNEIGRALNVSRCWGALGTPERAPALAVEYCAPAAPPSDIAAVFKLYAALMRQAASNPEGWSIKDTLQSPILAPVLAEARKLGVKSLLALPLIDREQPAGMLLVQQCDRNRPWTAGESLFLKAITTQIVIAVNNTKLRRLVRSLSGSDEETGLLPRSSYIDCLLAEAQRAKELGQPLSVCLLEPSNPSGLVKTLGDTGVHRYFREVSNAVQSNLRQNDVAIRYSPYSIVVVFPDTALPQGGLAVEKLRGVMAQVKLDGAATHAFCSAVCDVPLGPEFDAVDGVTEVINRLEAALAQTRKEGGKRVLLSTFGARDQP